MLITSSSFPPPPIYSLIFWIIYDVRTHVQLSYLYRKEAAHLKRSVIRQLWDDKDKFFKVLTYVSLAQATKGVKNGLVDVRELHGFTPWYSHTLYSTLHYTELHYSTLHYTTLHYSTLHYTTCNTLHYTTLHYTTTHYTTLHYTTPHYSTLQYPPLPSNHSTSHSTTSHSTTYLQHYLFRIS